MIRAKRTDSPQEFVIGILVDDKNNKTIKLICDEEGDFHIIKPKTIGKFTGAVDPKGIRVFEGDILYYEMENIYDVVVYDSDENWFSLKKNDLDFTDGDIADWDEVVGNIHESPGLFLF